jgi:membrane fusion protein, multidrug efflux system
MSADGSAVPDENAPLIGAVPVRKTRLQRLRWPLMSLAAMAVLGGGAHFYIKGSYQSTDDAYAQAATVSISANVGGRVSEIGVRDNEIVHRGAMLFKLDDAPFRIAVSDAAAHLADTRMQIESLKSTYRQRQVEMRAARDTQAYAQQQYDRQSRLLASGIASQAQFDQAAHALDAARQQVANVLQQIGVALANLGGDPNIAPERHPLVAQAQAALDRAQLNLSYTVISAPTDGVVAKVEQLQIGDTIAASAPVFALVSTRDV